MTLSDKLASRLRTMWPVLLGYLAAQLLVVVAPITGWLHTALGVDITEQQAATLLGVMLAWLIWELGRWLEDRRGDGWPTRIARAVGRWLLALGLNTGQPHYGSPFVTASEYVYGDDGEIRKINSTTTYPPASKP